MPYQINGHAVEHDEEGYITNLSGWTLDLANEIA